jgi:hypothetical protein
MNIPRHVTISSSRSAFNAVIKVDSVSAQKSGQAPKLLLPIESKTALVSLVDDRCSSEPECLRSPSTATHSDPPPESSRKRMKESSVTWAVIGQPAVRIDRSDTDNHESLTNGRDVLIRRLQAAPEGDCVDGVFLYTHVEAAVICE